MRTGGTPTDLQPSLFDIANDHLGDQHVGKEVLVPDTDFNPVPDRRALCTFVEADTDLERQQVVRRNLPVFLELMASRGNLARWRGEAGDPAGAAAAFEQLLADRRRVLGPDHPHTLDTGHDLAHWRDKAARGGSAPTAVP